MLACLFLSWFVCLCALRVSGSAQTSSVAEVGRVLLVVHETGVGVELRRLAKVRWHVGEARGEPTVGRCRKIRAHVRGMHYWRPHQSNIGRTQGGIIVQGTGIASVAARFIGRFAVARLNAVLLHRDRPIDLRNKKTEDWRRGFHAILK